VAWAVTAVAVVAAAAGATAAVLLATPPGGHGTARPLPASVPQSRPDPDATPRPSTGPVDRAVFAPGACIAYPPARGDTGQTVFIDAGHGGLDPGGTGYTSAGQQVSEAPVNLRIELLAAALLRARGYRVVVSRTRATGVARLPPGDTGGGLLTPAGVHADVAARDICANTAHADLLVGIYMNAGYSEGSLTTYDPSRPFTPASKHLATLLQRDVLGRLNGAGLDIPDDGVVSDIGLGSSQTVADLTYGHLLLLGPAKPG
jgi:N-acetylmuramoyl-L-alanine amidase